MRPFSEWYLNYNVSTLSFPHDDSPPRDLFGIFCIREAVRDGLSKNAAEFCLRSRV